MAIIKRGKTYYLRKMIARKRVNVSLHETDPRKAATKAHKIEEAIREGAPLVPTVAEWWERYRETYSARKTLDGGQKIDRLAVTKLLPGWGALPLNKVTPSMVLAWQAQRLRGAKPNTVRKEQGVLSAFFKAAVREGLITENPFKGVAAPRVTRRERVLSGEEQRKLLAHLPTHYEVATRVVLGTGLRVSELLGMTYSSGSELRVKGKGGKVRTIPLQPEVRALLPELRTNYTRVAFGAALKKACERAKIPHITVHDLRRTFATRCALAGMSPFTLAKLLGHSSVQTTDQYYVHVGVADAAAALNKVNLGVAKGKVIPMTRGKR